MLLQKRGVAIVGTKPDNGKKKAKKLTAGLKIPAAAAPAAARPNY